MPAPGEYSFVNLGFVLFSPIEIDEVRSWTAFLDTQLADGRTLTTVAARNNGKVRPPEWQRARQPRFEARGDELFGLHLWLVVAADHSDVHSAATLKESL